jgi:glucokinase
MSPASPAAVAAIDVGGTLLKGGHVGPDGALAHSARRPTGREGGPDAAVAAILDFAAELVAAAPVGAIGVAVPGVVDEVTGTAVFSANIGWRDVPLRRLLAERTGLPVWFGQDVRAGALAEGRFGAGAGATDFLFMPIGTGIGGAMVLGGVAYPGAAGLAGEIGHIVVRPGGRPCGCGHAGCLETYASAAAVAARYGELSGEQVGAEEVVARAAAGDANAEAVWTGAVEALADGLHTYVTLLNPALVVIGGGLALAGDALFAPLAAALAARLTFQRAPRLAPAVLGDQAGCQGAGLAAWTLVEGAR